MHSRGENEIVYKHNFSCPDSFGSGKKEQKASKPQMNAILMQYHGITFKYKDVYATIELFVSSRFVSKKLEQFKKSFYDDWIESTKREIKAFSCNINEALMFER